MESSGERFIPGISDVITEKEHLTRYTYALEHVVQKKVLDVACGAGYGTCLLSDVADFTVGVDISEEAISFAKTNYTRNNLEFLLGDATDLDCFADETFDTIISFETIEHIQEYSRFLAEMNRLLKSCGTFVISTPNGDYYSPDSGVSENPFHVVEFNLETFEEALKGFFCDVSVVGQSLQGSAKIFQKIVAKYVPNFVKEKLVPRKIRDAFWSKNPPVISPTAVEESKYLLAICHKEPTPY